ncbi:MAG: hypothetical protein L0I24_00055 [Pseudonocardia sp.]|nr:hypothetical protein [Pseudonocardia sp.]
MNTSTWHSAHVYHYDRERTDELLLDGIRPLLLELASHGMRSSFFLRHWLRGPHVRVHVHTDDATWSSAAVPLVEDIVGRFLRQRPSRAELDLRVEHEAQTSLARAEAELGPLVPWYSDNSIQYLPYDLRLHVLGTEKAAHLLARFHVRSTPLAFRILEDRVAGSPRLSALTGLMFASAHIGAPPISQGYLSYRSHAEAYFANCADPAGARSRFERMYQANRESLAEQMHASVAAADSTTGAHDPVTPYVGDWQEIARWLLSQARSLDAADAMPMPSFLDMVPSAVRRSAGPTNVSDFHEALLNNDQVRHELGTAQWFLLYRVLVNYQYGLFRRLGVTQTQRFLLCHLVARTVEDAYGRELPVVMDWLRSASESEASS